MKLAELETDSARQRLRESNLNDLENAFKEESPLSVSDSYDDSRTSVIDRPIPIQEQLASHRQNDPLKEDDSSSVFLDFPKRTNVENVPPHFPNGKNSEQGSDANPTNDPIYVSPPAPAPAPAPAPPPPTRTQHSTSDSDQFVSSFPHQRPIQASSVNFNNNLNMDSTNNMNGGSESDPFVYQNGAARRNSQLSSALMSQPNYQEYRNSEEVYSYRRTVIAAIVIILAIIGLAIGLIAPGIKVGVDKNLVVPAASPTASPAPTMKSMTTFGAFYESAATILIQSEVSPPGTLNRKCTDILCGGDGNIGQLTIQERTLHYLVFKDAKYQSWVFQGGLDNVERVIQRYIMTLFAFSTGLEKDGNNSWISETWFSHNKWLDGGDECDWFGLECATRSSYVNTRDFVDHTVMMTSRISNNIPGSQVIDTPLVIGISLNKNNLQGNLPQEIFKLRHLENIELWQNQIGGTIHKNVRLLTSLKRLWLHETNDLVGSIPTEIGQLTDLESVFIGGNRLSGAIPTQVGNLINMKTFAAFDNDLEGNIPSQFSECIKLKRLFLDQNNLNGTIPQTIGDLAELEDFRIHDNMLEGVLPPQFTLLNKLKVLYLNNNRFAGSISDTIISGLVSLEKFEASENRFSGLLSDQFGRLPNLDTLVLHSNEFDSKIPTSICDSGSLIKLDLAGNSFRGVIPNEIANCQILATLTLSRNNLSGSLPIFLGNMGNLVTLDLDNNNFSGQVPSNFASAPALEVVRLVSNNIEGEVSQALCASTVFLSADCTAAGKVFCPCCDCCNLSCNN